MIIMLSYKIDTNTPMYGGKDNFSTCNTSSINNGDTANSSKWELPNHLGTHIDFPNHFYPEGQTIDDFPTDYWIVTGSKIQLIEIDLPNKNLLINPDHVITNNINYDAEFLILKTDFCECRCQEKYYKNNPGLSIVFTEWIIKNFKNINFFGLDSISISSWKHRDIGRVSHKKLLNPKKPILIIEDMDLIKITDNTIFKMVYIAPLMISKANGSPCTILAEVS